MTVFAPTPLSARQVLLRGQVREAVTGRAFDGFAAALSYSNGAGQGRLPARLEIKPAGYYALHLDPARDLQDLSADGPVTLTLTVTIAGRAPLVQSQIIAAAEFQRVVRPVKVGTQTLETQVLAGAPFLFDVTVPARAVGLRGIVLEKHDPEAPLAGVKIRAGTAPQVTTAADGRFAIPDLPITETVSIELEGAGPIETVVFRPNYAVPVNTITLSLGSGA
jgi:hypothetical protein